MSGTISATALVVNGVNITANGGAATDNITSGTTAVTVNSATSTISFTTNGSVANYLDSSGRLITTGISVTTNQLSATTGYFSGNLAVSGSVRGSSGLLYGSNGYSFGAGGDTDGGMYSPADGVIVFATNYSEKMRINGFGQVGIGTASPTATLQVSGTFIVSNSTQTTTPTLYVDTNTGGVGIGTNSLIGSELVIQTSTSNYVDMSMRNTNGTELVGTWCIFLVVLVAFYILRFSVEDWKYKSNLL